MAQGRRIDEADMRAIHRMRRNGLTFRQCAARIGVSVRAIRRRLREEAVLQLQTVDLRDYDLPITTPFGRTYWTVPVKPPHSAQKTNCQARNICDACPLVERCRIETMAGNAAGCEKPLAIEFDPSLRTGGYTQLRQEID